VFVAEFGRRKNEVAESAVLIKPKKKKITFESEHKQNGRTDKTITTEALPKHRKKTLLTK
jgi:hypothetical protein